MSETGVNPNFLDVLDNDSDDDEDDNNVNVGLGAEIEDGATGDRFAPELNRPLALSNGFENMKLDLTELLSEPVDEKGGERVVWEYHTVTLTRVPGYGFGIAVSGGRDNPHFTNGDPAIAISDVLKAGPAEGKLQVNDRILSANGTSLENVDYTTAVQVLRDSGPAVGLVVKRRVILPTTPEPQTLRITLSKSKKKDDFGIVLGCRIYVKEISSKSLSGKQDGVREGDVLLKINNHPTDGMTLKEARKMIDSTKEKLGLVVRRDPYPRLPLSPERFTNRTSCDRVDYENHSPLSYVEMSDARPNYSAQNLYVQPPTRTEYRNPSSVERFDDKNNVTRTVGGRSRGPITDMSLSQFDRPTTPVLYGHTYMRGRQDDESEPPPRPPPPRNDGVYDGSAKTKTGKGNASSVSDYYQSRRQLYEDDALVRRNQRTVPDPRFISFQKEGSVGIRLTGGNEAGIFVTAVQPGSPASLQGLQPGDKILKVNDMDMKGVTREEAVLFLLSLQDQIDLIVQYRKDEYEQIVMTQKGDSFCIKTHFHYDHPNKGEMCFRNGDVFRVVDTLHNGVVGSWQVFRIGRNNQEVQKGIVPNKSRAEELATAQFNSAKKELAASESRGSFFRRRKGSHRRSKSLGKDHWDDVVLSDGVSKFPAYERVILKHPGFVRPVAFFGPVADLAREKLLRDFPDKFASPYVNGNIDNDPKSQKSGIIRLSAIRDVMERGKHATLDLAPNAVDRLNYAQFYPIVIFLRAESKQVVKELRAGLPKAAHRSSKKLYEQCQKLEKLWSHVFTATITLTSSDTWYKKVRELIEREQNKLIWISEAKPDESLSDDFLFPMASRFSYASSPESDLDLSPESSSPYHKPSPSAERRLVKSSSDPSIATQEDNLPGIPNYNAPPPYSVSPYKQNFKSKNGSAESSTGRHQWSPQSPGDFSLFYPEENADYASPPSPHGQASPSALPFVSSPGSPDLVDAYATSPSRSNDAPELPPKIDRTNKPGKTKVSSPDRIPGAHATGMDNEQSDGNYINAAGRGSSLKTGSYDGSSPYDSFNRLGPNAHDDLKSRTLHPTSGGTPHSASTHDPYRFVRSSVQPVPPQSSPSDKSKLHDLQDKYRHTAYKTSLLPKTNNSKPVPPPKPKNYVLRSPGVATQPPTNHAQSQLSSPQETNQQKACWKQNGEDVTTPNRRSKSMSGEERCGVMPLHHQNGADDDNGGFDSGHGSSLDRNYGSCGRNTYGIPMSQPTQQSGRGQYYYNVPPPPPPASHDYSGNQADNNGLDLVNREQRGSAFELYKKPTDPRSPGHHYYDRSIRGDDLEAVVSENTHKVVATARGVFDHCGGKLENEETGVKIIIPAGAISKGVKQDIYFKVCRDTSMLPPLEKDKGETLLSPVVMCGPHGLKFRVPVELQLPHCASANPKRWSFALKSSDTPTGRPVHWNNVRLSEGQSQQLSSSSVSVLVDHF